MRRISTPLGSLLASALACATAAGAGACDATGQTRGGELLEPDPCASPSLEPTWTNLYKCYFGPTGRASCTAQGSCHGASTQTGARGSVPPPPVIGDPNWGAAVGYICGTSSAQCWAGMTQVPCVALGVADGGADAEASAEAGSDAAGDGGIPGDAALEAATDEGGEAEAGPPLPAYCGIVPAGGVSDPTQTYFWQALRGSTPKNLGLHNMPNPLGGYTFTAQDLDRISAWIQQGAKDN